MVNNYRNVVALFLIALFVMMQNNTENANTSNINVDLTKAKTKSATPISETVESRPPTQINVPPSSTTVNPPVQMPNTTTSEPSAPIQKTNVQATTTAPVKEPQTDKGNVRIEAKVTSKTGTIQTVKNEKFYLLDEDIETILSKTDLEPIENNSLINSFGLSVMYPERYGEFNREALATIKKHIKYSGMTDGTGKSLIKDVEPDSYYLFGITNSKSGFAIWSSPVSINNGDNILNLSPASFNEISD